MRKTVCALMMTICLLLTSCGGKGNETASADELALNIRAEYLAMTACSAKVDVTADYGQRVYEYTIAVSWQKDGETVLTVLSPEIIAGITARIDNGTGYLEYDGASLETGAITSTGLSPVEAIPMILESVCTGYIASCDMEMTEEKEMLWICCRDPECSAGNGTEVEVWFEAENHALVRAEILSDGYTVVQCTFSDFTKE